MPVTNVVTGGVQDRRKVNIQESVYGNTISTDNESSTIVADGSSYIGTWEDVSKFDSLTVAVKTDQDGYYQVQFSPDGVNADSTLTRYYRTAQIEPPHRYTITRKYFRIIFYNNSGSAQTYFRLQVLLGSKENLNIPIDATMSQDYDSLSVRPTSFNEEVALGRRQGWETWNQFGYNLDIDGAEENIVSWGGTFSRMTSADTLDIVSSSANDASAGTGARSVIIYGVDENYDPQTEIVTLTGASAVTTINQWFGVNRVANYLVGSLGYNDGTLTVTATSAGSTQAEMPPQQGTTQQCLFFVARKHRFLATYLLINVNKISGGGNPTITVKGYVTSLVSGSRYEVYRENIDTQVENTIQIIPSEPFPIGEKSLLEFKASTDTVNTVVTCRFSGKLVRDIDY